MRTCARRCRPKLLRRACAPSSYGVCAGLGRRRRVGGSLHGDPGELRLRQRQGRRMLRPPPGPGCEGRDPRRRVRARRPRRRPRLGAAQLGAALPAQDRGSTRRRGRRPPGGEAPESGDQADTRGPL
eukprot:10534618-Alexandrium_andersonii.AAC.1